ncbi:hypothetical protein FRC14_002190 [Serendipita sp. 396]|nr:hypothetical protein FRC14_002190 [Serendipita sp. 396]KAG8784819.1 hypothetical protein FRC15_002547 [Serendipita sp. 397]KAG8827004.1 hypothetical protein FRC18_009942 [Serendipita sp. 400]KAG8859863.1 hypothetical protein FRB91_006289 [Serendipita sp. 411]KAG8869728.1 hypothetical protein FRC20_000972 [Serendipita sp. 405]
MSFLFTPAPSRQAHVKHSPSLTLERGLPQIRAPKPKKLKDGASFYTNADTGIDLDGVLKEGYVSGDLQSISPSPDSARSSFEPIRRSSSFLDPSASSTLHSRRSSATGHPYRPNNGQFSPVGPLVRQREEREKERRRRMRRAGGNVDCGTTSVLLVFMTICLVAILFIYFKVR